MANVKTDNEEVPIARWTNPGSDQFEDKLTNREDETACVNCGIYERDFRQDFLSHYAASGAEYGHFSQAYALGMKFAHEHKEHDWGKAAVRLRQEWEKHGIGPWDTYKGAIKFGWEKAGKIG